MSRDLTKALAHARNEASALRVENTRLREAVESLAAEFVKRAKGANESCASGCCSSAMSEARWQERGVVWGNAAAQLRGLLADPDEERPIDRKADTEERERDR